MKCDFDSMVNVILHPTSIFQVDNIYTYLCGKCVCLYTCIYIYIKQENVSFCHGALAYHKPFGREDVEKPFVDSECRQTTSSVLAVSSSTQNM
jgi:hypothetical protein